MKKLLKIPLVFLLTLLAKKALKKHKPIVIAITGSVGKTTTKDVLKYALMDVVQVRASAKSFNSDIGVPLSIFGLDNPYTSPVAWVRVLVSAAKQIFSKDFPTHLVLEVGAGSPGDVSSIAPWIRPHISIFTQLAPDPVHLEFFGSAEDIFQEKKTLAIHTREDGVVIYNKSDAILERVLDDVERKKVGFQIPDLIRLNTEGTHVTYEGHDVLFKGVSAWHFRNMVSVAFHVSDELGLDQNAVFASLEKNYIPTPGRGRIIAGKNNVTIIDDAYNASPVAVRASLSSFEKFDTAGRKIFVFGDMMELGDIEVEAHKEIAAHLNFIDLLITVGPRAKYTSDSVRDDLEKKHFETSKEAGQFLQTYNKPGDTILFKASRHSIKMEQAIVQVALPEERSKLVQEYL